MLKSPGRNIFYTQVGFRVMNVQSDVFFLAPVKRKMVFGDRPTLTLARVLIWNVIAIIFFHYLLIPIRIVGSSMKPTYQNGAVNFINRTAYVRNLPHRGDVVALIDGDDVLLKRIIGLPGETVSIEDGIIQINGEALRDRFSFSRTIEDMAPVILNSGEYFFIGDNREISDFGRVVKRAILGRIVF